MLYHNKNTLTLIPHYLFVLKMSAFYICCIYLSALQTRFFFMETSNMNYQEQPGPYCLQYRLPKNKSRGGAGRDWWAMCKCHSS